SACVMYDIYVSVCDVMRVYSECAWCYCFFFQAEDGIRDGHVTGVQTCAIPIWPLAAKAQQRTMPVIGCESGLAIPNSTRVAAFQIGRASCRERVYISDVGVILNKK